MPHWYVKEPLLALWIHDVPLQYSPAFGPAVSFKLTYNHKRSWGNDDHQFGTGLRWANSWLSYVSPGDTTTDSVLVPAGGAKYFTVCGTPCLDYVTQKKYIRAASSFVPSYMDYPDGTRDTYGFYVTNSAGTLQKAFLTQRTDAHGKSLTFTYAAYNPADAVVRLLTVKDAENRTTTLYYTTNHPANTNLISSIVDPFGRTTTFTYDDDGLLTNIVDVAGISTSFHYDGTYWMVDSMTTPYGTTSFAITDSGLNGRSVNVTEPNGGHHLYLYWDSAAGVPSSYSGTNVPDTTPFSHTFDNSSLNLRNTFYWSPLQYPTLGTTDPNSMTTTNFAIARLRHWLAQAGSGSPDTSPGPTLSLERLPSLDGYTEGQKIWYDHAGKAYTYEDGSSIMPLMQAVVLPDGNTRYTRTERNSWNKPTSEVSTYTKPDGTLGTRTTSYTYDSNGIDLTYVLGLASHQVVSNYFNNSYHQPDASYDALNQETKFTYNGDRQVTQINRPGGLTTLNIYFTSGTYAGWLDKTIDAEIGRTNSYTYANGLVQTHTDERGLTTTSYWDALQRLTGTVYPDSTTVSNLYTALDLTAVKGRLGRWTKFGYNSIRRRIAETNANDIVTLYSYCTCGSLDSMTAAFGTAAEETTQYVTNLRGQRWLTILPDGTGVTNWFDGLDQLVGADDSTGMRWLFYNNNQGLVTKVKTPLGDLQRTTYDIEDHPIHQTDANGVTTTNVFDDLGRVTKRYWFGGGETNGYTLNISGPTSFTNALSKVTRFVYEVAGRKTFETNANNEVIGYTYNAAGDLLTLKDGKSQTTTWQYDGYGRATNKLDQTSVSILTYTYDANSRLATRWSKQKGTTSYSYDAVGNLTNINYPASTDIVLKYDPLNRLTNMVDAVGTTAFSWAAGGQLFTEDGPWASDTVTNSYTKRLRTGLGLLQPSGYWTNGYKYDLARRLTDIASISGNYSYAYETNAGTASRLVRKLTLPNTSYITNTFDAIAQVTGTSLKNSSHTTLNSHSYSYNSGHQRTQQTFNSGSTYDYRYDSIGQLKVADSATSSEDRGYAYDTAWNLSYRTNNATLQTFTVNGKNELTAAPSPYGATTYDNNGNLVISHDEGRTYEYDDENQLIEVQRTTGAHTYKTTFAYDGKLRLRIRKEFEWEASEEESRPLENGSGPFADPPGGGYWNLLSETRYIYDGMLVIQERDGDNAPTVTYTRGNDLSGYREGAGGIGGLLARTANSQLPSTNAHAFYHADGNGNVTYLVDASQALAASYRYDPYGNTISSSGSLATANVYRFSSKEQHAGTGLYYYGYRWYAPEVQRWANRDPIGEDGFQAFPSPPVLHSNNRQHWNLYLIVDNSPLIMFDSWGLEKDCMDRCLIFCAKAPFPHVCAPCCLEACEAGTPKIDCFLKQPMKPKLPKSTWSSLCEIGKAARDLWNAFGKKG